MKSKSINFKATHPLVLGSRLEEGVADRSQGHYYFPLFFSQRYLSTPYPHTSVLWSSELAPKEINLKKKSKNQVLLPALSHLSPCFQAAVAGQH